MRPATLTVTGARGWGYVFVHDGALIYDPTRLLDGTPCNPDVYGFTVWETGGGCTAWRRDFMLDDLPVYVLVTAAGDPTHVLGDAGVYLDDDATLAAGAIVGLYLDTPKETTP